jgi:uncharacterized RDD family membrane protein YckC
MNQSGAPSGDEGRLEQEGIWEAPPKEPSTPSPEAEPAAASSKSSRALTDSITSTARTPGPAGLFYADVPNRIVAMVIDIIVLSVIGFVLALLFGGLVTPAGAIDSAGGDLDVLPFLVVVVLQLAISFGYFGLLWTSARGTVGMKLLGLQIGDESDGHSISWRQALVRWFIIGVPSMLTSLAAYVPSVIGVILTIVGLAWLLMLLYSIAQSPTKQGVHDRYARTILVKMGRRVA